MIRHTVTFRLTHPIGSPAESEFLRAAQALQAIPGVEKFEILRQIGKRNRFTFGLSMEFADAAAYASYNASPEHARFVQEHWLTGVQDHLEIDYAPYRSNPASH